MPFLTTFLHHPRRLFFRRALFQIHLWAGVLLSLYLVVISLSGSILVFEDELTARALHLPRTTETTTATIPTVLHRFSEKYPQAWVTGLTVPTPTIPAYQLRATNAARQELRLTADPKTAALTEQPRTWVDLVRDIHVYLLLGKSYGIQVNGIGAAILLLLAASGLILWWPGIRVWTRALRVSFRHNWRRINFDLHSAIGFWTLAIVVWWAISGVYFAWYKQVAWAVSIISPIQGMNSPEMPPHPADATTPRISLEGLLANAQQASPSGHLFSISDPSLHGGAGTTIYAEMDLARPGDFSHRDIVTLDGGSGKVLTIWHYGRNHTAGDWILWAMHPLHFGTLWGMFFKLIWAGAGIALAILTITGLLMYWNRYLRHRLKNGTGRSRSRTLTKSPQP